MRPAGMVPNSPTPNNGQRFHPNICNGCNRCVEICPTDAMMPHPQKITPPVVFSPEECWFYAFCIERNARAWPPWGGKNEHSLQFDLT